MEAKTDTITTGGADVFFYVLGDGPPLLLLHGLTGTGGDWAHALDLDALATEYRLVVPDARGHGRSTNTSGEFTFRRCALDLMALMDRLRIDHLAAVGMSLGAKTLLHLATEAPERIHRMILVSPAHRFPGATRALFRTFAAQERTDEEWASMRARHVHGDAQVRALWQLPARFADDPSDMSFTAERLAAIAARTLIVAGDRDPLYPVELSVELYRSIRDASLCVVPGEGHGPIFGAERARFEERALGFLRQR